MGERGLGRAVCTAASAVLAVMANVRCALSAALRAVQRRRERLTRAREMLAMPFFLAPFGFGYGLGLGGAFGMLPALLTVGALAWFFTGGGQGLLGSGVDIEERDSDRVAVARFQVGLLGQARQLQQDLDAIARKADTESRKGLHTVLVEASLALLRNPQYVAYGYSDCVSARTPSLAEARFNEYSLQERAKFESETLSNYGGLERSSKLGDDSQIGRTEYIVVTILLAYDGAFKLPKIQSLADATQALETLGRTQASRVNAVEVIWSPQAEGDTLTADELLEKFPKLVPL